MSKNSLMEWLGLKSRSEEEEPTPAHLDALEQLLEVEAVATSRLRQADERIEHIREGARTRAGNRLEKARSAAQKEAEKVIEDARRDAEDHAQSLLDDAESEIAKMRDIAAQNQDAAVAYLVAWVTAAQQESAG